MKKRLFLIFTSVILFISGCNKEWLDIKRDKKQFVPTTVDDVRAILDHYDVLNVEFPIMGEVAADDYLPTTDNLNSLSASLINEYIWSRNLFDDASWNLCYERIFYANTALEVLDNLPAQDKESENLRGVALFHRAWNFFLLSQLYSPAYGTAGDHSRFGIPLKLTPNIYEPLKRATIMEVYDQILDDLTTAASFITDLASPASRPDKRSVHALMAKTYLVMGDYEKALMQADLCLSYGHSLMDYKDHISSPQNPYPFPKFNNETIFYSEASVSSLFLGEYILNEHLYSSYEAGDLRRDLFWNNHAGREEFTGSYSASFFFFCGIAYDEVFLIRAESLARLGLMDEALSDLNYLLSHRYDDSFVPLTFTSSEDLLYRILQERRKQLVFRGTRWSDLRRLNANDGANITVQRKWGGEIYTLEPNSPRYVFPIPDKVVQLSGVEQYPHN